MLECDSNINKVLGGYESGDVLQSTQKWTQEFNLVNDYLFQFANHQPLKVVVKEKPVCEITVTDAGFSKPMNRLYKGDTLHWTWSDCNYPHAVVEVSKRVNQHSPLCQIYP